MAAESDTGNPNPNPERYLNLYLYNAYGDFVHSLYRIPIPDRLDVKTAVEPTAAFKLNPFLQFERQKYPALMRCVHCHNKLYFMGGDMDMDMDMDMDNDHETGYNYPNKLYIYDNELREGPSMETGKPLPFGFSARGLIYVVSGGSPYRQKLRLFEVFDPISQQWSHLPDPPKPRHHSVQRFTACVVVRNLVYLLTSQEKLICFDLDQNEWLDVKHKFPLPFNGTAIFAEDHKLYAIFESNEIGVLEGESSGLFNHFSSLNGDWNWDFTSMGSTFLAHLVDARFCHVRATPIPPMDPVVTRIAVTIFEIDNSLDQLPHDSIPTKLLHKELFFIDTGDDCGYLLDSFVSRDLREVVESEGYRNLNRKKKINTMEFERNKKVKKNAAWFTLQEVEEETMKKEADTNA